MAHGTTTASEELFAPISTDLELCYQTFGDADADPLLLVMGLGGPMTWWPEEFCRQLAEAGFYVIRYDNRDTGRSSRLRVRVGRTALVRAFVGAPIRAPYGIGDLADDAFALLDHLGLASAHVAGISMGGMIAQTMAVSRPERVRSLTSIMSSTGRRTVGFQHPVLLPTLIGRVGPGEDGYVANSLKVWKLIGSPGYPTPLDELDARARETFRRGVSASGVMRQMLAVLTQPDRTPRLRELQVPTLVVHGLSDRMVHVSGGRATAAAVPDAELMLIGGMGHDTPVEIWPRLIRGIRRVADRA